MVAPEITRQPRLSGTTGAGGVSRWHISYRHALGLVKYLLEIFFKF
jgi:hypothetical protein